MKEIRFLGNSEKRIAEFPQHVMIRALHELDRLRHGLSPTNWKPMRSVGTNVPEIRRRFRGAYRIIYMATGSEVVFVLHAFRKTSAKTRKQDIELVRKRLRDL